MSGVPRTTQMTSRVSNRTGLKSVTNQACTFCHQVSSRRLTCFNTAGRRKPKAAQLLMEPKAMIRPSGIAPMSVMAKSLSVCKKPVFSA